MRPNRKLTGGRRSDAISVRAEGVRQRMYTVTEAMILDGCSTSYRPACVERGDYGQWVAVPAQYALAEVCGAILALAQHPNREYEDRKSYRRGFLTDIIGQ